MGPVSEQDMFSDIYKVNLFSKSSHDKEELQQKKKNQHKHRYARASVHVSSRNSQTHRILLSLCGSVFSGIMLRMKTVHRSCLQDVRDICKTDYMLWVKSQCLRGVLKPWELWSKASCYIRSPGDLSGWSVTLSLDCCLYIIYFKDGEAVVEFKRDYASISKDASAFTYQKQAVLSKRGSLFELLIILIEPGK